MAGPNGTPVTDRLRQVAGAETAAQADPAGPPRTASDVCTIADLAAGGAQLAWLWPGWIPQGVCTAVAAEGGIGKTRFCADLVRRIRHGLPWPDGQPMTLPAESLALWVVADNHHDEMVTLARTFEIDDVVRVNAWKEDPYAGVSLETAEDLGALDTRINLVKPVLVVVDTVGNATDHNLSKQEEAKAFYFPLQVLARRHRTAMLCLTHLNADGKFLGRRVLEKVRLAIKIEKPDPASEKRRLSVPKSNAKIPSPLGLTMHDCGNDYDADPPAPGSEPGAASGRKAAKSALAESWLRDQLSAGPRRVSEVRKAAETAGISPGTLYRAREAVHAEQYESEGKQWWRLTAVFDDAD